MKFPEGKVAAVGGGGGEGRGIGILELIVIT